MPLAIQATEDDVLSMLTGIGVRLTREYWWATGGPYAGQGRWVLPIGPAAFLVDHQTEPGEESLSCFRWLLRAQGEDRVMGVGRWHPAELTWSYWFEFESKVLDQLLHTSIATLAAMTRCTRCSTQEFECHNQQRADMRMCCMHCHHPLTLRRVS